MHISKTGSCNEIFGRAVLSQDGLTIGKIYRFKSYRVLSNKKNQDIALLVTVEADDYGKESEFNFRCFEEAYVVPQTTVQNN